jgi:drug/metabolite transporter (DMT)-like permease
MRPVARPPVSPLLGIALGLAVVSTASIAIRYAQAYAPSIAIAAWRLTVASLVLIPILLTRERAALRSLTRRELALGLASGAFLALHFATWITSLETTTVASSVVLVSTMPLFVALLAPLTIREAITPSVMLGLALALAGGTAIALGDAPSSAGGPVSTSPLAGDLLATAGALAGAGYLLIGRSLRRQLSLLAYISLSYTAAAAILLIWMILAGQPAFGYPLPAYGLFIFLALGPQLLGHSSFNWALRYLPASVVAVTLLGEPVGSSILAFFLLGERPSALKLGAMAAILAGIYLAARPTPGRAR